MKYIVYLTTNTKNGKVYVGVHKTEDSNKFDGYLGCGVNINKPSSIFNPSTPFHYAVKKYGFNAFKRVTIKEFENIQDALDLESYIVDENFIKRNDTYNITLGGGLPPLLNKITYQYSLDGIFIKEWNSIVEAAKTFNVSESSISKAIIYKKTSANYLWSDCKVSCLNFYDFNIYNPKIIVYKYNYLGEFEDSYESMSECAKKLDSNLSNVQRAIKLGIKVKGFYLSDKLTSLYEKPKSDRLTGMIHQYNLDGTYIQSFNSIKEAEKSLGFSLKGVNNAIKINNSFYKNYLWRRGVKLDSVEPYKIPISKARKIGQYTMKGTLIKVFDTLRACKKEFPNVSRVLNGSANHCHNYTFKYIE